LNPKVYLTDAQVADIRAMKLANPKMAAKNIREALNLKCGITKIYYTMYNLIKYDPNYHPVLTSTARRNANYDADRQAKHAVRQFRYLQTHPPTYKARKPKRKPSIECACLCSTCGMGYDRMDEALDCCRRALDAITKEELLAEKEA